MSRREKLIWLSIGFAFAVGCLSLVPAHYEICLAEKTLERDCTSYQLVPFVAIKAIQVLDRMGGVLTALATIAIAWFTLSLRQATDRMWDAGERQLKLVADTSASQSRDMQSSIAAAENAAKAAQKSADTLANTERPWIFISKISPAAIRDIAGGRYEGTGVPVTIMLEATIKNYGKTPALMSQIAAQLRFSRDPAPGILSTIPPLFFALETGAEHTFHIPVGDVLNAGIASQLQTGGRRAWLHFTFIYRDVSGALHETSGRWRHDLALGFWDGEYEKTT